ncbi:unnamed protein product [Meloidogyne enterolobii]|uniref:Uncharacterized protein n=1 Tax=Meloidogyne enterolobii TaxID=390850 RepID=A0ACB0YG58_MELEN
MFSLPNEVRLDILKCLNFNQLFSQRQTNFYFCNLINKYEEQLAKKKFNRLWNAALAKSIQLYLEHSIEERPILIRLETIEEDEKNLLLVLPAFPKNIKDLVTLRCWFEHLFGCAFEYPYVGYRFNPELIRLLFDDDETIPHQFLA